MMCVNEGMLARLGYEPGDVDAMRQRAPATGVFPARGSFFGASEGRILGRTLPEWLETEAAPRHLCLVGMTDEFNEGMRCLLTEITGRIELRSLRAYAMLHAWSEEGIDLLARFHWHERAEFREHALRRGGGRAERKDGMLACIAPCGAQFRLLEAPWDTISDRTATRGWLASAGVVVEGATEEQVGLARRTLEQSRPR